VQPGTLDDHRMRSRSAHAVIDWLGDAFGPGARRSLSPAGYLPPLSRSATAYRGPVEDGPAQIDWPVTREQLRGPSDRTEEGGSTDVSTVTAWFGRAVPPAAPRFDVTEPTDGFVDISDVSKVAGLFGQACPSSPRVITRSNKKRTARAVSPAQLPGLCECEE